MIKIIQTNETKESLELQEKLKTDPELKKSLDKLNLFLETGNYKHIRTVENDNKIGRNDPCYCGSGIKYKKCHGKVK